MQLAGCIIRNEDGKVLLLHRNTVRLAEPHTFDRLDYFDIDEVQALFNELWPNTKNFVLALKANEITL